MRAATASVVATLCVLGGCALRVRERPRVAHYDLGPAPVASGSLRIAAVLVVAEPSAPVWIDSRDMHYRLAYEDPSRLRRFAGSRWALSPVELVAARLRNRLAAAAERGGAIRDFGTEADYWVRAEIEEFGQVFDSPTTSRGIVRLRIALVGRRGRAFVAQRAFEADEPAPTPDARGGVAALATATARVAEEVTAWIAQAAVSRPEG